MLKILQICNKAPFPADDGSCIAIYNMAKGLMENGANLHMLCINTKKHFKPDSGIPAEFRRKANYSSVYRNTNTSITGALLNLIGRSSYFVSRFYFSGFNKRLSQILTEQSFDVIQLEGLFMGVYLNTIKRHSKAKVVLRAHNIEHYIWNRHILIEKNPFKKLYLSLQNERLRRFETKIMNEVDAIVTITSHDASEIQGLGINKPLFTCITGVDIDDYQTPVQIPEKPKTIFYFGSMDWLPNNEAVIWFLTNCWDKIHKAVPDSRFIVAGKGMPEHFHRIKKPNVLLVENVPDSKTFYRQHQLMIVPLWSGSGLRIKIIEGMSYGKAIVSTSIGAEGIPCDPGKNILIADNAADFSDAVIDLLLNDNKRKSLETESAIFARNEFDNKKVVAPLIQFYKQLLNG